MGSTPDLGPMPTRITVDVAQVRRLVGEQFPEWAGLPVRPVAESGWDNWTFRLGEGMVARLPSATEYALAVDKEQRWLPVLAPRLPLPVPAPLAKGKPGAGYPFSWSVHRWLDGEPAGADRVRDPVRFALDLSDFLMALRNVDAADGPRPGKHNWFRGGTLRTFDPLVERALTALDGEVDVGSARDLWKSALDVPWDGVDRWFHGDVAPGNLLLDGGRLAAVIDFGTCGVGDPSCDLAIAWTLLTDDGRRRSASGCRSTAPNGSVGVAGRCGRPWSPALGRGDAPTTKRWTRVASWPGSWPYAEGAKQADSIAAMLASSHPRRGRVDRFGDAADRFANGESTAYDKDEEWSRGLCDFACLVYLTGVLIPCGIPVNMCTRPAGKSSRKRELIVCPVVSAGVVHVLERYL
ncbi:aminoglycoside phosphotransferase family protein [Amycolatopsis sp. WAC 04182]|uniref:aminoglycoside phosphotransferase family protein n=1 Tax=Amycolatopsis sp. WAC 04182 TaxID=2203198 RepID=UPI001F38E368|nr:aminoglycoside phosphotransferase family protein [Amycolatopsis sp. WAC 04182]